MAAKGEATKPDSQYSYWQGEITRALKRFSNFHRDGEATVDAYRMEKADGNATQTKDKYNILFSSTETIRPNLYAQRPVVYVKRRQADRTSPAALDASLLLEANIKYCVDESDFDDIMDSVVEDNLLPGLGQVWLRYVPTFKDTGNKDAKGNAEREKVAEIVIPEYVYWKDFLTGVSRTWATVPWISRTCYMSKDEVKKRFGNDIANAIQYSKKAGKYDNDVNAEDENPQAVVYEIWDKRSRKAVWYCESYPKLLDEQSDPLGLKDFWPCPRPLRAISNNRTFIPKGLYSVYKTQAEQLDQLTRRIRLLTEAIRVSGVYDGSQPELATLLNPTLGNKMIAVSSWAVYAQQGGMKGSVEWLPLEQVVTALMQLLQAREVCKNEIYEITGFSDIVRGVSKASETLGAQNIKANWAGARIKKMQKDVQRFARDIMALMGEIISEHFSLPTLVEYSGMDVPRLDQIDQNDQQAVQQAQVTLKRFQDAAQLLKAEGRRCAVVDIETDSTIMADEQIERADRMQFMTAASSFLQQAVPAMESAPQLAELLGALLMFGVRSYPSARPVEEAFARVQQAVSSGQFKTGANQQKDDGGAAKSQSAQAVATIRAQVDQQRLQQEERLAQAEMMQKAEAAKAELALKTQMEQNRHQEQMLKLRIEMAKLEQADKAQAADALNDAIDGEREDDQQQHDMELAARDAERQDMQQQHGMSMAEQDAERQDMQADHSMSMEQQAADTAAREAEGLTASGEGS